MIITGAPVEHLAFEEVNYWEELKDDHGLDDEPCHFDAAYLLGGAGRACITITASEISAGGKVFGVFPHTSRSRMSSCCAALTSVPTCRSPAIRKCAGKISSGCRSWKFLSESEEAGVYIVATQGRQANFRHRPFRIRSADAEMGI